MCGRYYLERQLPDERLRRQIARAEEIAKKLGVSIRTEGELHPTEIVPVLAPSSLNRAIGAFPMRWGFSHPKRGMLVFNTRMETATEKALFVTSVNERRCLIPASGYYEWKTVDREKKRKQRFRFIAENGEPLYLAGLYLRTNDPHQLPCFSILTQNAEPEIRSIHPRMPVAVPASRAEEWLSPETDFQTMLRNLRVPIAVRPE